MKPSIYPLSFRMAQSGVFSVLSLFCTGFLMHEFAGDLFNSILAIVIYAVMSVTFLIANYVIIRYPFLSLLPPNAIDLHRKYFSVTSGGFYRGFGLLVVITFALAIVLYIMGGLESATEIGLVVYLSWMLGFIAFLTFFYDPEVHPTTATFLSVTLGFGVPFSPLFIPALIAGRVHFTLLLRKSSDTPSIKAKKWSG